MTSVVMNNVIAGVNIDVVAWSSSIMIRFTLTTMSPALCCSTSTLTSMQLSSDNYIGIDVNGGDCHDIYDEWAI